MDAPASIAELETAAASTTDPAARARAQIDLASELARTGDARRALVIADDARTLAGTLGDRLLTAEAGHAMARCHFYLADFTEALELLLDTTRAYQELGDLVRAATALAGVGLCQHRLGASEDAIATLLRALESAQEQGLATLEVKVYNSLGSALLGAGRTADAAERLAIGVALARERGNDSLLTKLLLSQSLVAQRRGDDAADDASAKREYATSHELVQQALLLARALGNRYDEAHCLGQSGALLRRLGRPAEAAATLDATVALARQIDEAHVYAEALLELGRIFAASDVSLTRRCLSEAAELAEKINARNLLADARATLSAVCEREGELAAALAHYKQFHAVREQQFAAARQHAARAAELWLDFQQASRAATRYRKEAQSLAVDKETLARQAEVLTAVSQHDPLTGLLNRRGLDARIGALVAVSEVNGTPLTIALIDVDRFKTINDTYSHPVGDAVLRRIGVLIRMHCRAGDLPVRFGGDEFLLVLAGADGADGTPGLERLKAAVDATRWDEEAPGLKVTLSIGAAMKALDATIAETIAAADEVLYAAKAGGRDRIVIAGVDA